MRAVFARGPSLATVLEPPQTHKHTKYAPLQVAYCQGYPHPDHPLPAAGGVLPGPGLLSRRTAHVPAGGAGVPPVLPAHVSLHLSSSASRSCIDPHVSWLCVAVAVLGRRRCCIPVRKVSTLRGVVPPMIAPSLPACLQYDTIR